MTHPSSSSAPSSTHCDLLFIESGRRLLQLGIKLLNYLCLNKNDNALPIKSQVAINLDIFAQFVQRMF